MKKYVVLISIATILVSLLINSLNNQANSAYNQCISNGQQHNVCIELYR